MVTAEIKINGSVGSQDNLSLGVSATLTNNDNTGVTSWLWQLLSRPPGSGTTINNPTNATASFTPDVVGSYLIKLTVSDGSSSNNDQVIGAVLTDKLSIRIPAAGETTEFKSTNGWAEGIHGALITIDGTLGTHAIGGSVHTSSTLAQLNTKISDATLDDSSSSRPPSGAASGDLGGTYPSPTVDGIQGRDVASTAPTDGQVLVWDTYANQWEPGEVSTITSFIALTDTPLSYVGQGGKFVYVNYGESGLEFADINFDSYATKILLDGYATPDVVDGYAKNFINLGDTPNSYSGQGGKIVIVKPGEDGLEFTSGTGVGNLQQAYDGGRIIEADNGPVEIDAYGREALNIDGYIGIADGYAPIPLSNKGLVYVQEIGGIKHLFYMDSDGTAYQLTAQGHGLETEVDDTFIGATGVPVGPFPWPPLLGVTVDVTEGEDVLVSFSGSADSAATVNPFENVYCRLEVDAVQVYVNRVTVIPMVTGFEAADISFSFLLKNLTSGSRSITISIDVGTAPGDPAGTAGINNPVLGVARVQSEKVVTLQKAYQNGRFIYAERPIEIDAYGNEAFNIDGYVGFEPTTTPSKLGNKGLVYVSTYDGYSELFYLDDYGKSSRITNKGNLNSSTDLDSAYDGTSGSGSGRIINVDSGPVLMYVSGDDGGLNLETVGNLDGNPILKTEVTSESNVQIGVWHQLTSDGYYEPRGVISDLDVLLPSGGNYTAVGITSNLLPGPYNPSDTTLTAFKAGIQGEDILSEGTRIAYEAKSTDLRFAQFDYALYADTGNIRVDSGDLILKDGYIYLGEINDPTYDSNAGFVYTKDVNGYTELFYMDNYGSVIRITSDGYLNASSSLDSAYDGNSGSGSGREITADFGAVLIDASGSHAIGLDGYLSLSEISDPTNIINTGIIYSKDVSGYTELFYMDNYGSSAQITDDGYLNASTSLDSAYDGRSGSGAGREIVVDSGPVELSASGNEGLDVDGYIGLQEISEPVELTDKGLLYSADVSGNTELFYKDPSGNAVQLTSDGYLNTFNSVPGVGMWEQNADPTYATDKSYIYSKDVDGYSELKYMDNYGNVVQLTSRGLPTSGEACEDEIYDGYGTETYIDLTNTPASTSENRSGRDLNVYRNGILIRYVGSLGSDKNEWTYNSSLNRVEFIASASTGDWYIAVYRT